MFTSRTFTRGSPRNPSARPWTCALTIACTCEADRCRAAATRFTCRSAFCGEMYGSRPEPDVVTASGGTWPRETPLSLAYAALRSLTFFSRPGLLVPRLDAPEDTGSQPKSVLSVDDDAVDGRGWKYCGSGLPLASTNSWQMRLEPTTLPPADTSEPLAWLWRTAWPMPSMTRGYIAPVITVNAMRARIAARCWPIHEGRRDIAFLSPLADSGDVHDDQVDELDPDERDDQPAESVDPQVPAQQRARRRRRVPHAAQRQRDERDDDQRVEHDRRRDRRRRAVQAHDVEVPQAGVDADEHGRQHGEVLRHVVGDGEGGQRAPGEEQLLADLDDLDELGRVGVQVDHVPGLLGGRGPGVHRHADVGLGERRGVVGTVAGHRDELAALLLLLDQRHLVLRGRLGQEVVHAGLLRDGARGERVVAGDHDGLDAHLAQLGEPLADPFLDDVLEVDDAQRTGR